MATSLLLLSTWPKRGDVPYQEPILARGACEERQSGTAGDLSQCYVVNRRATKAVIACNGPLLDAAPKSRHY
jgi:hypothetical protein